MQLKDFSFPLNNQNIAQSPGRRGKSRLLVLKDSLDKSIEHCCFKDLLNYLEAGDVLVLNNSKVIPTRLWGVLDSQAQCEVTLVRRVDIDNWEVMVRPGIGINKGAIITFCNDLKAKLSSFVAPGIWKATFSLSGNRLEKFLYKHASVNFPFYLRNPPKNLNYYQTVYASIPGSGQPPTAGLHFTLPILRRICKKGVKIAYITLHISGSILSITASSLNSVCVPKEWFSIKEDAVSVINIARSQRKKIFAVGTTVMRALESAPFNNGSLVSHSGWTNLTILPGFKPKVVNGFLTNFHLPMSSHLLLTCSFSSRKRILTAYQEALKLKYMFLDFGDSMLIL